MPTFRSDLSSIPRYVPGRTLDEVVREFGLASISQLASNEWPNRPFPEVVDAIASAAVHLNRYPDNSTHEIRHAIAAFHGVAPEAVWVGSGSSDLIRSTALSVGGPATSAVFADPSFILYPITTTISGAESIRVPLAAGYRHDLDRMLDAIRADTTLVYVCSPNNPTGGHLAGHEVRAFLDDVSEAVVVIVDEAYAEFVTAADHDSVVKEAPARSNVLVLRTFSKIYGLAGLRIGYGIGNPDLIANLHRTQAPFAVTTVAQVGALEALKHQDRVKERALANAEGREFLTAALFERGFDPAESQANFVYFEPAFSSRQLADDLMAKGVIVRRLGAGLRVTVGTPTENAQFVETLDELLATR
ncbi:MAG: histidinol-phosphate transaminase [Acidimicrobiia bacterium]|nr:histidinol-phosphate transaminase [Acidimicrobiia bacterium]